MPPRRLGVCHREGGPTATRRVQETRPAAPNLVGSSFKARAPDRLRGADITSVPTRSPFLYLAVTLNVFSRRIVGWSVQNRLRTELIVDALDMAAGSRKPKQVIHHSDQGCPCPSLAFGSLCGETDVWASIGFVGDARDRCLIEGFPSTLDC